MNAADLQFIDNAIELGDWDIDASAILVHHHAVGAGVFSSCVKSQNLFSAPDTLGNDDDATCRDLLSEIAPQAFQIGRVGLDRHHFARSPPQSDVSTRA